MPFLLVVLALVLLVVLHELGHFLAARAVGIRATKFYVFFPPALFKRQVGEVEYGIGAIPAGGFVKLPGMFEPEPGDIAERLRYEYETLMPLVRDGDVRLRLDAARRSIAHAGSADDLTTPLGEIRTGLSEMRGDARDDGERRAIDKADGRIAGMLDDAHPMAYWRASLWRRMVVIFAGPLVNLVVAFVVLTAFWWFLVPQYEVTGRIGIESVRPGSPAAIAGLDKDSQITRWNGSIEGLSATEYEDRIIESRGKPLRLTWVDDGATTSRTIFPARLGAEPEPRVGFERIEPEVGFVGRRSTSLGTGTRIALSEMREITWGNLSRLPRVFFDKEIREDVGSVVGIVQVADEVDRAGQFVRYVAVISLILAVMNLLPLLPLDGGHLLFGLLEATRRGRPLPRSVFERYSLVGMALVLALFFIGLDNDIARSRG